MESTRWAVVFVSTMIAAATCGCAAQSSSETQQQTQLASEAKEESHFQKALDFEAQGQWELAKQEYRLATRQDPRDSRPYVNLGRLYARDGQSARAEECWHEALRVNPSDARASNLLGSVCLRQREFGKAITYYQKALEADPNYANAHWNIAGAYRSLDMKRQAAQHYRRYIQLASPSEREDVAEAKRYLDAYAEK